MSRRIAPFIDIVRLEDKEAKLKSFVRTVVDLAAARNEADDARNVVLLVARSIESPVARAVATLVKEGLMTPRVRAVLALVPRDSAEGGEVALTSLFGSNGARLIRDSRLFDAHEQLVLGASASWIGDCMRRDPMKRDAYECFAADCAQTAGWARLSFERLWAASEPLLEQPQNAAGEVVANAQVGAGTENCTNNPPRSTSG